MSIPALFYYERTHANGDVDYPTIRLQYGGNPEHSIYIAYVMTPGIIDKLPAQVSYLHKDEETDAISFMDTSTYKVSSEGTAGEKALKEEPTKDNYPDGGIEWIYKITKEGVFVTDVRNNTSKMDIRPDCYAVNWYNVINNKPEFVQFSLVKEGGHPLGETIKPYVDTYKLKDGIAIIDSTDINICCADIFITDDNQVYYHTETEPDPVNDDVYCIGTVDGMGSELNILTDEEAEKINKFTGGNFTRKPTASNISGYISYYGLSWNAPVKKMSEFISHHCNGAIHKV